MIISLYTTKGGVGKTTTAITLLSTLAQFNAVYPEQQMKVLAIDLDAVQGTLLNFAQAREKMGRPDHNITFTAVSGDELTPARLAEIAEGYDMVIIDMPGFYDEAALQTALVSDVILVPSNIGVSEYTEANDCLNALTELREKLGLPGFQSILLTRTNPVLNMTPKFSKIIFKEMVESGHAVLNAKISSIYAYQLQMDYGAYLFELQDDGGKGVYNALEEANVLLGAATNFLTVDASDTANYQKLLVNLGKLPSADAANLEAQNA